MDRLFIWIFWISMIVLVIVWAVLIYFCVKYRSRPDRKKAIYSQGNIRLEMAWTLAPAVILIVIALVTKRVWDNYRYAPHKESDNPARVLVIGQQFKWNVIYPGPDKKLGRYLMYPKSTDLKWPAVPEGQIFEFTSPKFKEPAPGPAFMPRALAEGVLNQYIEEINPLGKDFSDAEGRDDNWEKFAGRDIELPKGRPLDIHLSSRDVLHDFFLPNFRVKLDAVPGLRGHIYFTATKSSAELEAPTRRSYSIEELEKLVPPVGPPVYRLVIPKDDPRAEPADAEGNDSGAARYWEMGKVEKTTLNRKTRKRETTVVEGKVTIVAENAGLDQKTVALLKGKGFTRLHAYRIGSFDLVCEELCGSGHTTMKGTVVILEPEEYRRKYETPASTPPAAELPVAGAVPTALPNLTAR